MINFIKRHKVLVLLAIAILAVGGYFVRQRFFAGGNKPQYQTATVSRGTIVSTVAASGQVVVTSRYPVNSAASGVVTTVYVKNGETVAAGQKILTLALDPAAQQKNAASWNNYLAAAAQLSAAQAKINSLQSALFKANQAFITDRGVADPTSDQKADPKYIEENADWLSAEADYKNQQGVVAAAAAGVNSTWLAYQQTSPDIISPVSGTVADLTDLPGMTVAASLSSAGTSTPQIIASVLTGGKPTISVNLAEADVNRVSEGERATVTLDALPDKTFTGKVLGINKTGVVSSGVTNYPATVQFDTGAPDVLPNMAATANIITATKDNVLVVPSEAVQTGINGSTVRVLKNGQVQSVAVETGLNSDTQTEITSGLSEGDVVITSAVLQTGTTSPGSSPFSNFRIGGGGGFGGGGGARGAGALNR